VTFSATFRVDGIPKAQPRAKATMRGRHAGVYDPGTSDGWKALVAIAARPMRPASPIEGAVAVGIDLFFPRPKSLCRRKDPEGLVRHIAKPDRDNCEKAILDALKQDGWFRDDSQVCDGRVRKFYHAKGGRPGAQITIRELADQGVA
jgi:Holliday junction resolvase RusA-like endonuclease